MKDTIENMVTIPNPYYIGPVRMEVQRIDPNAKMPFRARPTDAGYDISSIEEKEIPPGEARLVKTGIKITAPPGWYYTIDGRSSLWMVGVEPNRGIIDSTYCGEVVVSLVNFGSEPYQVKKGERIAQVILHRQYDAEFVEVEKFSPEYNQRGEKGFGSTGKM